MTSQTRSDLELGHETDLVIGGMTCASCAARIEKKLNRIEGVTATVNYATEKARVHFPDGVTAADLIATVEATGYTAEVPAPPAQDQGAVIGATEPNDAAAWRQRLVSPPCWRLLS